MTKTILSWISVAALLGALIGAAYWYKPQQANAPGTATPASKDDLIVVDAPLPDAEVSSPLAISGRARGNWYFEASFPVRMLDGSGKELGVIPAQAQGEWMTTEYVPFSVALFFATPTTPTGTLVLEKDNPSGLPEHANELRIPVRFTTFVPDGSSVAGRLVTLYYYDAARDQGPGGAQCSRNGLVAVERRIPVAEAPLKAAIELLLRGELTLAERAQGLTTEFPLQGVVLTSASITDGVATLTFVDQLNRTSGGSCRVGVLWFQIEATAKQFPTVTSVRFLPEELFQP